MQRQSMYAWPPIYSEVTCNFGLDNGVEVINLLGVLNFNLYRVVMWHIIDSSDTHGEERHDSSLEKSGHG